MLISYSITYPYVKTSIYRGYKTSSKPCISDKNSAVSCCKTDFCNY